MRYTLHVRLKKAEGSLVRLLGQIGRRGYDVLGVRAELSADGKAFDVVVEFLPFMPVPPAVQQARPAEVLPALVAKLIEVEKVELRSTGGKPLPAAPGNGSDAAPKSKAPAGTPAGEQHFLDE
jgi:acetolactate synthase regulatory subunit